MSFTPNGIKLNTFQKNKSAIFLLFLTVIEFVFSILFVVTLASDILFPEKTRAAQGVSEILSYQGRLTDSGGNSLSGTYCLRFSIYDAVSSGNQIWPASAPNSNSVSVSNGVFNIGVGEADDLGVLDFSATSTVYLNTEVYTVAGTCTGGSWETLSPRQRIDATAYARVAEKLYGGEARIGTGGGSNSPKLLYLDVKNTADALDGSCSIYGTIWFNSANTRALICENGAIKPISNSSTTISALAISGNTAGTPTTITGGTINLAGGNNITLSQNGNSITISAFNQSVQTQNVHNVTLAGNNTSGTLAQIFSGTMTLAGGNNITLSQVGNAITISGAAGGGGGIAGIAASNTTYTSGTVIISGGANITVGTNGQTITISAAAGGGGGGVTISSFEPFPFQGTGTGAISLSSNTSAGQMMFPFFIPQNVAAEYVAIPVSMNFTTGGTSSFRQSGTLQWGLFTRPTGTNSTRLSNAGSGSFSYAVTYNNNTITLSHPFQTDSAGYTYSSTTSAGLNITSGYTGLKQLNLYLGSTITPGQYWLGFYHRNSSSSFNSGVRISLYGNSITLSNLAPIGRFSSAYSTGTNLPLNQGGNWLLGNASYTVAGQVGLQTDVTMSQMSQNMTVRPYMKFVTRL